MLKPLSEKLTRNWNIDVVQWIPQDTCWLQVENVTLKCKHPNVTLYLVINLGAEYWEPAYMPPAVVQLKLTALPMKCSTQNI